MSGGILVTEGVTFSFGGLSISINNETGEVSLDGGRATLHYDVCPAWLSIAVDHLKDAKIAREQLLVARDSEDDDGRSRALEREFRASMQAITSSAIAIDAFYAVIKKKLTPDAGPYASEKRNAARFAQVSETLRQAFQLKPIGFGNLREAVKKIFSFRDQAVHPTGNFSDPVLHPELEVGVERRFVMFRYDNAFKIVQVTVSMISELAAKGKSKNVELEKFAKYAVT
jgi:hypothetical protein